MTEKTEDPFKGPTELHKAKGVSETKAQETSNQVPLQAKKWDLTNFLQGFHCRSPVSTHNYDITGQKLNLYGLNYNLSVLR
jgi:hypothetical protein